MAYSGDDQVLIRIAVFGIAMSVVCTAMIAVMFASNADGDYDFDTIQGYRDELSEFTGESMLNMTPWVLTGVYTPWMLEYGLDGHVTDDNWLYGEALTGKDEYPYIGKVEGIKLDPKNKSSRLIGVGDDTYRYMEKTGLQWWANHTSLEDSLGTSKFAPIGWLVHEGIISLADVLGIDKYVYDTRYVGTWDYTGYRYVFDPVLPFQTSSTDEEGGGPRTSVKDGALSVVWYSYNGQEGLSGALDVYGGDVLLASYSATDIIAAYNDGTGHATHYEFDFQGTMLDLYVQFDEDVVQLGMPLMEAWTNGHWSMAISSLTVGNFLDIDGSSSYAVTGGGMVKTFIQIYTMSLPNIDNDWMNMVLWLLVGLPMTLAMAMITLKIMGAVKIL